MVRGRDSPLGLQRGRPAGAHVPPRRSQTQGAKGCSRPASPRRSSYPKTATWTVQGGDAGADRRAHRLADPHRLQFFAGALKKRRGVQVISEKTGTASASTGSAVAPP